MNGFNLSNIQDAKLGSTQVSALYYGSTKLWPLGTDYSKEYLTIESLKNNNEVYFVTINSDKTRLGKSIEYSTDLSNWISVTDEWKDDASPFINLSQGQKVYLRGTNSKYATSASVYDEFYCTQNFSLSGNIMSLIYGLNFTGQTTLNDTYTFACMFRNNASHLRSITNLVLPATTLTTYCYYYMFSGCTGLISVPSDLLPATTLAYGCYYGMFYHCTSLTSVPELPAMKLSPYCYVYMFENCPITSISLPATTLAQRCYANMIPGTNITSLTLPATTLYEGCYRTICYGCTSLQSVTIMGEHLANSCLQFAFYGCTSLNYIKFMSLDGPTTTNSKTSSWVTNVPSGGTFVKNRSATWTNSFGNNAIPSGWTVVNV